MTHKPLIHIIDDDEAMRNSLALLFKSVSLCTRSYHSAVSFLDQNHEIRPGCIISDIRMPGVSGLELQGKLQINNNPLPIIFISGHGDIPMAVKALKNGAVDFIEKPFREQDLLESVHNAISISISRLEKVKYMQLLKLLSVREAEVLRLVVDGMANKVIATKLSLSKKTIEFHRSHIMIKLKVESLAELVRLAVTCEII